METASTPTVLLLNLPPNALGGIDLLSFSTTPRFQGVKNLPAGFHFVFTGSTSTLSVRHGAWFQVKSNKTSDSPPLFIKKWDSASETLLDEQDETARLRQRANLGSIWREGLTPYRQSTSKNNNTIDQEETDDFPQLTANITPALLTRITGATPDHWALTSASSAQRDLDDIPGLTSAESRIQPEKELVFLPIDLKQTWRPGATGRERTDAAQDRSWALGDLVEHVCTDGNVLEVLGELQFCFLMVLTLNNWSCLEQWKRILTLLFTSKAAVLTHSDLFVRTIATLRLQLGHSLDASGGLFDLTEEGGALLKNLLARFRKGLEELGGLGEQSKQNGQGEHDGQSKQNGQNELDSIALQDVTEELDDLEDYLRSTHGWQFGGSFAKSGMLQLEDGEEVRMDTTAFDEEDESGEYAPVIVDLTPDQARLLGASGEVEGLSGRLSRSSLRRLEDDGGSDESESGEGEDEDEEEEEEEEEADLEDMDARC